MTALTFAGVLSETGVLEVLPGFVVDAEPTPGDGRIEVLAIGRRGRPIARTQLPLLPVCAPPESASAAEPVASIVVGLVGFPEEASGLVVLLDGKQVWERTAPAESWEVRVDWPGGLRRERFDLEWDTSPAECAAALAYSSDGGETWLPLSVPSSARVITADLSHAAGGDRCLLELFVTDGFTSQRVQSQPYVLEAAGWQVWIHSPAPGAQVETSAVTQLRAEAIHLEERHDFRDISWSSSLDGALGTGARLSVSLSPGSHVLTASAMGAAAAVTVDSR